MLKFITNFVSNIIGFNISNNDKSVKTYNSTDYKPVETPDDFIVISDDTNNTEQSSQSSQSSVFNIYVLECDKGKYYIGKTKKPVKDRYNEHLSGKGSKWTSIYKPIKIVETFISNNEFDEDNITKKYMKKYGIDNVRGGSYVQNELFGYQIKSLNNELNSSENKCFRCGKTGHFVAECNMKKSKKTKKKICEKCGRNSHTKNNCFAKTKIDGTLIK